MSEVVSRYNHLHTLWHIAHKKPLIREEAGGTVQAVCYANWL